MTISNETKIGALTALAITLLILGFNFLKGKSLSGKTRYYTAVFQDIQGLANSNPVVINGKEVGTVYSTDGGKDMRSIKVVMNMKEDVNVPDDSYAVINKSLLGNVQINIKLGSSTRFISDGGLIKTQETADMLGDAMKKVDPILFEVRNAAHSLDTLLGNASTVLNPAAKQHFQSMLENMDRTSASLSASSKSLQALLDSRSGSVTQILNNVESVTGNLRNNNEQVTKTIDNLESTSAKLARLDLESTISNLNSTLASLRQLLEKGKGTEGSLGLLMNDPRLYNNLTATSNKLNLLLDDLRLHPKRYVNVSVFGRKDKSTPLSVPMPDTVNAPYIQKQ
jgi:phospholipid/cholesterol/gamma-HCH transport system substrate-binding protein